MYVITDIMFEFRRDSFISPSIVKSLVYYDNDLTTSEYLLILNIIRATLCIYTAYLISIKIYYREVLPPIATGIIIDSL